MRPRGTPPTPSAMSSEMEPVEMTWMSRMNGSSLPSRMMEPLPNWRSTAPIASSIAFSFSGFTAMGLPDLARWGAERRFSMAESDLLVDSPDTSRPDEPGRDQRGHPRKQRSHPVVQAQGAGEHSEGEDRLAHPGPERRADRPGHRHHLQGDDRGQPHAGRRLGHSPERQAHG